MDQEKAKALYENGALFVLLDFPEKSEFGIDYTSWHTGSLFKGVKMIPPGIHFIYYSVASTRDPGQFGFRNGFFYNFNQKEILVKKWNKQNECIDDSLLTEVDLSNISLNKKELDRYLGAYPYEEYKRWIALSNKLNMDMVTKLSPQSGIISSASTLVGQEFTSSKKDSKKTSDIVGENLNEILKAPKSLKEAEQRLPQMYELENTAIRFTPIKKLYPEGTSGAKLTAYSIDMSFSFEYLLKNNYNSQVDNILCELQFAFICFLIGQLYDAFEQWKNLLNLICNSEEAILINTKFYLNFIQIVYFQLKEVPKDFFYDILSKNNFLTICLHNLFDNVKSLNETNVSSDLKELDEKCYQFKAYLKENYMLDFEEEPDEYAPTVCTD